MTDTMTVNENLTGTYTLDPAHTRLGFVARHAMVTKVRGQFSEFDGRLHIDAADPARSTADLRIKVDSLSSQQAQRDEHLRNADFFEAERYPEMAFTSTRIEVLDDDRYRVTGDLTIKDVTKPVTIDLEYTGAAKDPFGNVRVGFEGRAQVNRKEWKLTWNAALETGGFLVSDKVALELDLSAIRVG